MENVVPSEKTAGLQETKRRLVENLNQQSLADAGSSDALESAIANYELAAKMQVTIPELMDLSGETEATKKLYGMDSDYEHTRTYARECILARRLVERGVRFIELTIPSVAGVDRWDAHSDLKKNHGDNARAVDQPIAALLQDLKQRGLLDHTLVLWAGEFGRTPFALTWKSNSSAVSRRWISSSCRRFEPRSKIGVPDLSRMPSIVVPPFQENERSEPFAASPEQCHRLILRRGPRQARAGSARWAAVTSASPSRGWR